MTSPRFLTLFDSIERIADNANVCGTTYAV